MVECDICGMEVKNLGSHKYQKHRNENKMETLTVDTPTEKPLSDLIENMKALLRPYQSRISVSYQEEDGKIKEVEITARIQTRR